MFVVKRMSRAAAWRADQPPSSAAGAIVHDTSAIVAEIVNGLQPYLAPRIGLQNQVEACVTRCVAEEVRFVAARQSVDDATRDFVGFMVRALSATLRDAPVQASSARGLRFEVSLVTLIPDAPALIQMLVEAIVKRHADERLMLGAGMADVVVGNLLSVSKLSMEKAMMRPKDLVWPREVAGSHVELATMYLRETHIGRLLLAPITVNIAKRIVNVGANQRRVGVSG